MGRTKSLGAGILLVGMVLAGVQIGCMGDRDRGGGPVAAAENLVFARDGVAVYARAGREDEKVVRYVKFAVRDADGTRRLLTWDEAVAELSDDARVTPLECARIVTCGRVTGDEAFLREVPPDEHFATPSVCPCPCCSGGPPPTVPCTCDWGCLKDCYRPRHNEYEP